MRIVGTDIRTVGYIRCRFQLTEIRLTCKAVIVTIKIRTIHKVDGIHFTTVIEIYSLIRRIIEYIILETITCGTTHISSYSLKSRNSYEVSCIYTVIFSLLAVI